MYKCTLAKAREHPERFGLQGDWCTQVESTDPPPPRKLSDLSPVSHHLLEIQQKNGGPNIEKKATTSQRTPMLQMWQAAPQLGGGGGSGVDRGSPYGGGCGYPGYVGGSPYGSGGGLRRRVLLGCVGRLMVGRVGWSLA